jgi:plastocyanin
MSIWGRRIPAKAVAALAAMLVLVAGLATATTRGRAREITLVAKGMAFYIDGDGTQANPVIEARPGETLRIVLKNRDRGITHDFAVPAVDAATDLLAWNEDDDVTFDVPDEPGTYEYVCRPHLLMMKGTLKVSD